MKASALRLASSQKREIRLLVRVVVQIEQEPGLIGIPNIRSFRSR